MPGDRFPMWIALGTDSPVRVDLTVDQQGYISLPQIGTLHVAGMIGAEVEASAAAEYEKRGFIIHPTVPYKASR